MQDSEACLRHLVANGLAGQGAVMLRAFSAGGVLAANLLLSQPSAFGAVALRMPFLDLFTAMMDPEQALTQHEWAEWGDPRVQGSVALLQKICPYQVLLIHCPGPARSRIKLLNAVQNYLCCMQRLQRLHPAAASAVPPVLVTAGMTDERVPPFMPAKWVAALRKKCGSECKIFLNVHPGGHFLPEHDELQLSALEAAFMLHSSGLDHTL